jgi:dTDP-glucose pyrophosphorylase
MSERLVSMTSLSLAITASLRDAVRRIEESRRGIAVVADPNGVILGTVTDGDIRRAILRGGDLETPVVEAMNRSPVVAPADTPDRYLAAILQDRGLEALPLVDGRGRLVRVTHIRDLVPESRRRGGAERFVAAVVMAGGEGTRLRPITDSIPKPMIEVGGMPLVERHVRRLAQAGIERAFIAVNYLGHHIEEHFSKRRVEGIHIEYLREGRKLGTAGALSLLPDLPSGPLLVVNVIHAADYINLLSYHCAQGAALTVAAIEHRVQIPYGVIRVENGRMVGLDEKPSERFLCNAGIYVIGPVARARLRRDCAVDMPDVISDLAASGAQVCVFPMHEFWADIADADDLARVRTMIWKLDSPNGL